MAAMSPLLAAALADAQLLIATRGWTEPNAATVSEAQRLLDLLAADWPVPSVQVEPDGSVALEWEAASRGWTRLSVDGSGMLEHSAVIDGDEYEQVETFANELPDWALEVLRRLFPSGARLA
jgi:hypothetical protein